MGRTFAILVSMLGAFGVPYLASSQHQYRLQVAAPGANSGGSSYRIPSASEANQAAESLSQKFSDAVGNVFSGKSATGSETPSEARSRGASDHASTTRTLGSEADAPRSAAADGYATGAASSSGSTGSSQPTYSSSVWNGGTSSSNSTAAGSTTQSNAVGSGYGNSTSNGYSNTTSNNYGSTMSNGYNNTTGNSASSSSPSTSAATNNYGTQHFYSGTSGAGSATGGMSPPSRPAHSYSEALNRAGAQSSASGSDEPARDTRLSPAPGAATFDSGTSGRSSSRSSTGAASAAGAGGGAGTGGTLLATSGGAAAAEGQDRQRSGANLSFEQIFRFDITIGWITQQWPRVTTLTPEHNLQGFRVPVSTGTSDFDLAGSLSYYFDSRQQLDRIIFHGTTGDPRRLVAMVTGKYHFERAVNDDPSMFVYRVMQHGYPASELQIRPAKVIRADAPRLRYEIDLAIKRPD